MTAELTLGAFDLIGGEGNGWKVETLAEGVSFGSAAGRDVVIQTLLQDGAAISRDGYDNREVSFSVIITASDSLGLAQGEAALAAEIGKRNELVWTPPDNWGPPSVFVVVMSSMVSEFNDWGEMEPSTYGRRFNLSFTCKPFAQSVDRVLVPSVENPGGTPVTTVIDDCTSTTGWTGTPNTPTTSGGAVRENVTTSGVGAAVAVMTLKRFGLSSSMTATPFLRISMVSSGSGGVFQGEPITVRVNGEVVPSFAKSGEFTYFQPLVTTITDIEVSVSQRYAQINGTGGAALSVSDITRTNVSPFIGTGRQQFRSLTVTGSARTEGRLQIAHPTVALGVVAAYTNADDGSGYQPACEQYRTAGDPSPIADATSASGSSTLLNTATPETYDIPSRSVPEGTYAPMARLKAATPGYYAITLVASLLSGASELGSVTVTQIVNVTSSWAMYELGSLSLPTVAVPPGSLAKVRLELSSTAAVQVDDTYIFNTTIGALTVVDCGTGTPATGGPSNRLWIDTASLDVPRPAMWVGTQADRSDAHHVEGSKIQSEMPHRWSPGVQNLFLLTDAEYATASLDFPPNWHTNAAS